MKKNEEGTEGLKTIKGFFKQKPNQGQYAVIAATGLVIMLLVFFALAGGFQTGPVNGSPDILITSPTETTTTTAMETTTTTQASTATTTTVTTVALSTTMSVLPQITATPLPVSPSPSPSATPSKNSSSLQVIPGNYVLVVYQGTQVVVVYEADKKGNYDPKAPVRKLICSTGSGSKTPNGEYKIRSKYRYHQLFGARGQYCSRFDDNLLFHSVPIDNSAKTLNEGRSMMKVNSYNKLGSKASSGCIRLTVRDAKWIYDNCPSGTRVIVTKSKSPVGGGSKPPALIRKSPYSNGSYGWDPTDPDPNNPYHNGGVATTTTTTTATTPTTTATTPAVTTPTVTPPTATTPTTTTTKATTATTPTTTTTKATTTTTPTTTTTKATTTTTPTTTTTTPAAQTSPTEPAGEP